MEEAPGESVDQFVSRLRQKAITCKFEKVDEAIRGQLNALKVRVLASHDSAYDSENHTKDKPFLVFSSQVASKFKFKSRCLQISTGGVQ